MLAWLAATGCVHHTLYAHPADLGGVAPGLRKQGIATVNAVDHDEASVTSAVAQVRMGDQVSTRIDGKPVTLSMDALLANCPAGTIRVDAETRAGYPDCALLRTGPNDVMIGRPLRADNASIFAVLGLAGAVGLGVCAFECRSPWSYASGATLVGAAALAAGVGVFLYALSHYD